MDNIIKIKNTSYARYEELLLQKDELRKEAFVYHQEYIRVFGTRILAVFEKKIECIRKKKTISYCQFYANQGKTVDQKEMQEYLQQEMEDYRKTLDEMVEDHKRASDCAFITEAELLLIKKIYHRIVKRFHPDINPQVTQNKKLMDLWQRVLSAYTCNNLKELQEAEVLVNAALQKLDHQEHDIEIPNITDKIHQLEEEIEAIKTTNPYQYRYLLEDEYAVEEQKLALKQVLAEYEAYSAELDQVLEQLMQEGVVITWKIS